MHTSTFPGEALWKQVAVGWKQVAVGWEVPLLQDTLSPRKTSFSLSVQGHSINKS